MIREKKSEEVPSSLSATARYDGEDVKKQLLEDQHEKCYICERKLGTDFQIDHFKSQENYGSLRQEWKNLFLACGYCNGKKSDRFDNNISPLDVNVEDEIEQRIDFNHNKASFRAVIDDEQHRNTVEMLCRFYNGKQNKRLIKEERFFDEAKQEMISFLRKVYNFQMDSTRENRKIVAEELSVEKEMLGFKYWIILDCHLEEEFKNEIIWNKK